MRRYAPPTRRRVVVTPESSCACAFRRQAESVAPVRTRRPSGLGASGRDPRRPRRRVPHRPGHADNAPQLWRSRKAPVLQARGGSRRQGGLSRRQADQRRVGRHRCRATTWPRPYAAPGDAYIQLDGVDRPARPTSGSTPMPARRCSRPRGSIRARPRTSARRAADSRRCLSYRLQILGANMTDDRPGFTPSSAVPSPIDTPFFRYLGGFAASQRIANSTQLVQEAPRDWRERIVAALSDQTLREAVLDYLTQVKTLRRGE